MTNNQNNSLPPVSCPTWQNWSGNLVHQPALDGVNYYFAPTNFADLKAAVATVAQVKGATLRVSGQRHSQPPLVANDNRGAVPKTTTDYLVDMACYQDLGPNKDQRIVPGPGPNQVTANVGVREDELDAFLTANNLMLQTVTAGGFFSVGGMTAVDVHGATVDAPIFAETAAAFTILLANGTVTTIDARTPAVGGWSPLQFARVSLGGLGVVTSVTLDVLPRPYATTLQGGRARYLLKDKQSFISQFQTLLSSHTRLETFFTPYAAAANLPIVPPMPNFLALWWDVVANPQPQTPNSAPAQENACGLAGDGDYGAPVVGGVGALLQPFIVKSQQFTSAFYPPFAIPPIPPSGIAAIALDTIEKQVDAANSAYSELWLSEAAQVIFMSYYIPLPDLQAAGLGLVWDGLDVVSRIVTQDNNFHIAAPMEFRFVKGGDSAMSGAYTDKPGTWFVNLDLIAWVDPTQTSAQYPAKLLQCFADAERVWVNMGGFTHNGKMFGFYDPAAPPGTYSSTGPFNPNFLASLQASRGARLQAYKSYRQGLDPRGLFYNEYLQQILEPGS